MVNIPNRPPFFHKAHEFFPIDMTQTKHMLRYGNLKTETVYTKVCYWCGQQVHYRLHLDFLKSIAEHN